MQRVGVGRGGQVNEVMVVLKGVVIVCGVGRVGPEKKNVVWPMVQVCYFCY
jgi:hypothetical protein